MFTECCLTGLDNVWAVKPHGGQNEITVPSQEKTLMHGCGIIK